MADWDALMRRIGELLVDNGQADPWRLTYPPRPRTARLDNAVRPRA
jgi:hypothetical protein